MESVFRGAKLCFPVAGLSHAGQMSPHFFFCGNSQHAAVTDAVDSLGFNEGSKVGCLFHLGFLVMHFFFRQTLLFKTIKVHILPVYMLTGNLTLAICVGSTMLYQTGYRNPLVLSYQQ